MVRRIFDSGSRSPCGLALEMGGSDTLGFTAVTSHRAHVVDGVLEDIVDITLECMSLEFAEFVE
jgi:hypothetical protein